MITSQPATLLATSVSPQYPLPSPRYALRKGLLTAAVVLAVSGCAVDTKPLSIDEQQAQITQDRSAMFSDQEPVSKPITLSEAIIA